jgi:hypothetical protein
MSGVRTKSAVRTGAAGAVLVDRDAFEAAARATISEVRTSLRALFRAVDADPSRPQLVARRFGLNKNLTWKLSKVVGEEAPQVAVTHLPGKPGLAIFVRTMEAAGAPVERIAALKAALAELDALVARHAGDRETLGVMLSTFTEKPIAILAQKEESIRRASFQGNSALWGIAAQVQLGAHVLVPSRSNPDLLDIAVLGGLLGLRRLRPDVVWPIGTIRVATGGGVPTASGMNEAVDASIDLAADPTQVPLLRDYCTQPLPDLRIEDGVQPGTKRVVLGEGPVGNTAATTFLTGRIGRGLVGRWKSDRDQFGEHLVSLTTPVETAIIDLFVHADLELGREDRAGAPVGMLYGQLPGMPSYPNTQPSRGLLPLSEKVLPLGSGASLLEAIESTEVPQYRAMLADVAARLGVERDAFAATFRGYRLRLRWPPMPVTAVLRSPLPTR